MTQNKNVKAPHGGGPGHRMSGRTNEKLDMKTLKRLVSYILKNNKLAIVIIVIGIIVSALVSVASSLFMKTLIDSYITPLLSESVKNYEPLFQALSMMALVYLSGIIMNFVYQKILVYISQGTIKKLRDEVFAKMETLPIKYFDTHSHGDIMSVYTNDIDTLRQMLSQSAPQLMQAIVTLVSVFVAMLSVSFPLTVFVLFSVSLMGLTIRTLSQLSGRYFKGQQEALGEVNGYIEEMMHGQKVIKVFNHERVVIEEFTELNDRLAENTTKANRYANILMPVMMNLLNIQYVLIAIVGGLLSINGVGALTIGGIAAFLQLSRSLNMPVSQISQQINFIIMSLAGADRIFTLMDEPSEVDNGTVSLVNVEYLEGEIKECSAQTNHWAWKQATPEGNFRYIPLTGDVRFEKVDFSYTPDKKILKEISLFAKSGQKIAFVGATGAGKTTIINLINRFYDIEQGEILYDGINIQDIKKESLRRSLGIVLQDTHLFTGTIRDNIRYSKLDATDEEVEAAAKLANADYFISHLPQGYDTVITGDGGSLSQGQRQLLSIARAAIVDPPVMVLDEATSSIDTRTERIVQNGMDALMKGRTVFVIAHRLSTIQNSDVIIVLDQGAIIERGNHEELLAKKGTYYQLATGQLELD